MGKATRAVPARQRLATAWPSARSFVAKIVPWRHGRDTWRETSPVPSLLKSTLVCTLFDQKCPP